MSLLTCFVWQGTANASVTADASRQYIQIIIPNGGDSVAGGAFTMDFTLGGDLMIGEVGSATQKVAIGFQQDTASPPPAPADTSGANVWYVNDTSLAGDVYTTAIGNDANDGLSPSTPKRTLNDVDFRLTAGDTVYVDAGWYYENDTVTIAVSGVSIIGKDSGSTVVRFDTTAGSAARAIYASNRTNLTLRDLRVTNGRHGIWWKNVDLSTIERVRSDTHGQYGIYLDTGSGSGSDSNTLTSNTSSGNANGIYLVTSSGNTLTWNTILGGFYGIFLEESNNNTVMSNTSRGNFYGTYLGTSSNNRLTSNTNSGNAGPGILLSWSNNNTLTSNTSSGNSGSGISLSTSSNNKLTSNTVDSNAKYAFYLDGTSKTDTFSKNVFYPSQYVAFKDSGVYVNNWESFLFERNWWGTTDSQQIDSYFHGLTETSASYIPYRLGPVDTAIGIDTVAPRAPDTVVALGIDSTSLRVFWAASSGSEEPESATTVGGYRVYRSKTADTSYWARIGEVGSASLNFTDTDVTFAETYYYRVTAYDAKTPFENEAFYSDSISGVRAGVESTAPLAFSLLAPMAGAETNTFALLFSWGAALDSSPVTYRLIVDTDLVGNFVIDSTTTTTSLAETLPRPDTYLWRVIATDTWGNSTTSGDSSFLIETTPPTTAAISAPTSGTETGVTSLFLSWTAASDTQSGLSHYRIQLDTAGTFTQLTLDSTTTSLSLVTGSLAGGTYTWRVISYDDAGNTSVSSSGTFIINISLIETAPPAAFTQVSPTDGTETNAASIRFQWNLTTDTGSGIAGYTLEIDTSGTFTSLIVNDSLSSLTDSVAKSLVGTETYYWRVFARDNNGNTAATVSRKIIVDTRAGVTLVSPDSGSTQDSRPTFQWTGVSAETYTLLISTSASFTTVTESATTTSLSRQPTGLDSGSYYWRVIASDKLGNTETATARLIRIDTGISDTTAPAAFSLLLANAFETSSTSINFQWGLTTDTGLGITEYRLQVSTSPAFTSPIIDSSLNPLTDSALHALIGTETYYWGVIARDAAGNTTSAGPASFTIDTTNPGAPTLVSPIGGAETTVTSIRFDWSDAVDAHTGIAGYKLHVSQDSSFVTTILSVNQNTISETTPNYIFTTTGTYYWRVVAIDKAGNIETSATDSFVRPAPADNTPPSPVGNLTARPNTDGTITLCWLKSPATDMTGGGQYNIYWDNATGLISETSVPLAFLLHNAVDTRYCYTTAMLTNGSLYSFIVRAQDKNGNENSDSTKVSAYSQSGSPPVPHAVITQPRSGNRVLREVALVVAQIDPDTQLDQIDRVIFHYRPDTTNANAAWETMLTLTTTHPNPAVDSSGRRFKIQWDIQGVRSGNPPVLTGVYNLRAVAVSRTGQRDTTPPFVTLAVVDNNPDRRDTKTSDGKQKTEERIHKGRDNTVVSADTVTSIDLSLPEGALSGESTTVILTIDPRPTVAPPGRNGVGGSVDIILSSGQTNLSGGKKAKVKISYSDTNSDGVIDGTSTQASDLELWTLSNGIWEKGDSQIHDSATTTVSAEFSHFSTFILAVGGAQANLNAYSVYPNPWKPNDGDANTGREFDGTANSGITFINLPDQVQLKIFTIRGAKVIDFATHASGGSIQWDVRNDENRPVASGWYFYSLRDLATGQTVMGKIAVVR